MDNRSLVSIIIPVYNVNPYLEEALDSVIKQTYENLEIIIIDDGSTDGSSEICDMYAARDERITVIHQENRGISNARNAGLDVMHGEYVAFLDPDDALFENYVEELLHAALLEKTDITIGIYTCHQTIGKLNYKGTEMKAPSFDAGVYDRIDALRALVDGRLNMAVWNKLYHANLWTDIRYPDGQVFEDVVTTFRVFDQAASICFINKPLYMKRVRPGSITDTLTQKNCSDGQESYSTYESLVEKNTPDIFSYEQLRTVRSARINWMINFYIGSLEKKSEIKESFRNQLKGQIIKMGEEIGTHNLCFRTRLAYKLVCKNPKLLRVIHPIYRKARQFVYRCTGK